MLLPPVVVDWRVALSVGMDCLCMIRSPPQSEMGEHIWIYNDETSVNETRPEQRSDYRWLTSQTLDARVKPRHDESVPEVGRGSESVRK